MLCCDNEARIVRRLELAVQEGSAQKVKSILMGLSKDKKERVLDNMHPAIFRYAVVNNKIAIIVMLLRAASTQRKQELLDESCKDNAVAVTACGPSMVKLLFRRVSEQGKKEIEKTLLYPLSFNRRAWDDLDKFEFVLEEAGPKIRQNILEFLFPPANKAAPRCKNVYSLNFASLLLAHVQPRLLNPQVSDFFTDLEMQAKMARRVRAYSELIGNGFCNRLTGIISDNATLQLVCKNVSKKFQDLLSVPLPLVCTFLGIPQFQQAAVVIPMLPCLNHVERFENEEKKPSALR